MASDDFDRHPLFFLGCTWDDAEDWNDPENWAKAYPDDLPEPDRERLEALGLKLGRAGATLLTRLAAEEDLPRGPGAAALRVLDAGCGWTNLPYAVARLGCDVTALDFAPAATRLNEALRPCRTRQPLPPDVVSDLGDRASRIGRPGAPAGGVTHRTLDWLDDALAPASFDAIYVCNSLRISRKPYWRRSLARFAELLTPEGLLIVLSQNARAIAAEVAELAELAGFEPADPSPCDPDEPPPRSPGRKRFVALWPTG